MEQVSCLVCNSNNFNLQYKISNSYDGKFGKYFNIVKCQCGFVYLNPRPDESEMGNFYGKQYVPHLNNPKSVKFFIYKIIQKFSYMWKRKIVEFIGNQDSLLDIGGGDGSFCLYMKKYGWDVSYFDNSHYAQELAMQKNLNVYSNLDSINKKFDVITLWHSLEHIHNIKGLFAQICRLLKSHGLIIIAVPNINAVEKKYFLENWVAFDTPRHLYHFSYHSIEQLLNNFDIQIIKSYSMILDTFFNILYSSQNKNFFKIFYIIIVSLFLISIYGVSKSSSMLLVCQKK